MLNVSILQGRLTADPELRHTQSGTAVTRITLAVERDFKGADGQRETDFIDVVAWRGTAEFIPRYFRKGDMIIAYGSLQTRKYEDKNGNKRTAFEVVANNVEFCGGKQTTSENAFAPKPVDVPSVDDFSVMDEDVPF